MAKGIVSGEQYFSLTGQLLEIFRQLRQPSGYPFDAQQLGVHLQAGIEGRFSTSGAMSSGTGEIPAPSLPPGAFSADATFFNMASGVNMVTHGANFTKLFTGRVEVDVPEGELRHFDLKRTMSDGEITKMMGGKEKSETTLSEIWRLMKRQANGEKGELLTNGSANIFYVRDKNAVLRTVFVRWFVDGWRALADDFGSVLLWLAGDRAFSRNS